VPENPKAILHDKETGAVVYTELTAKEDGESIRMACPYDIPRVDPKTKVVNKCDMCIDRVRAGKLPACVQACPTGTMNFGDREDMLKLGEERLAAAKKKFPKAMLVDPEETRVIYLAGVPPENYYEYLEADASDVMPDSLTRKQFLAKLGKPIRSMHS
jgi:formate dehydrogenase iron-sulfur subunit